MRCKKYSPLKYGALIFFICIVSGAGFLKDANSAGTLVAKTSLTVVNVSEFVNEALGSPSEVIDYKITHDLWYAHYGSGLLTIQWGPLPGYSPWPRGSNILTGRIWSFRTHNLGKSYVANAWDYILNSSTHLHVNANRSYNGVGTMVSSLCHTNATCNAQPPARSNIMF